MAQAEILRSSNSQLEKKWRVEGMNQELKTEMPAETMQIALVKVVSWELGTCVAGFQLSSCEKGAPVVLIFQFLKRGKNIPTFKFVNQF